MRIWNDSINSLWIYSVLDPASSWGSLAASASSYIFAGALMVII
jgi:hypothetical protein